MDATPAQLSATQEQHALIQRRILHLLGIYPVVSPTMLHVALGPSTKADNWKPVLEELIEAEIVGREFIVSEAPTGRHNTYTKLFLNGHADKAA